MRWNRRVRWGSALSASVAIHLVIMLAWHAGPSRDAETFDLESPGPIELEIVRLPKQASATPVADPERVATPLEGDADEIQQIAGPPQQERAITVEQPALPSDDRFRIEQELDLRPRTLPSADQGFEVVEGGEGVARGAEGGEAEEPESRRIERRLDEIFAEERAVVKAKDQAHSYWRELKQGLQLGFSIPLDVMEQGPGPGGLGLAGALSTYQRQARAYAATGNPHGDGPLVPGARGTVTDLLGQLAGEWRGGWAIQEAIGDRGLFAARLVSQIELVQDPSGAITSVTLAASSGNRSHDRAALDQAHALASDADLGPPPAQGRRTRWAFVSTLSVTPPIPMAGCALGADFLPDECFYPMKKSMKHRVLLLAIYDQAKAEPQE